MEAHLDGYFHGGRAVVRQEAASQAGRRQLDQLLGEQHRGLVGESREYHVFELAQLFRDRGVDARMGMAEQIDPPGTHGVEIALTVEILEPGTGTPPDGHHRKGFVVFHLGAGMPNDSKVARGERGGIGLDAGDVVHILGIVAYANAQIGDPWGHELADRR